MDFLLSHVVANIFKKTFDTEALESTTLQLKVWFHYVNTFIDWTIDLFLEHLNKQRPYSKFTIELEPNNSQLKVYN